MSNLNRCEAEGWDLRYLTDAERMDFDLGIARIMKKYNSAEVGMTDIIEIPEVITKEQARRQAEEEHEELHQNRLDAINEVANRNVRREAERRARSEQRFRRRTSAINTGAGRRGMQLSTVVIGQLDRALARHNEVLETIDANIDFNEARRSQLLSRMAIINERNVEDRARRIHSQSVNLNLRVLREISIQRNRTYRNWLEFHKTRLQVPINTALAIADERRDTIRAMLFKMHQNRPPWVLFHDPIFIHNMPLPDWMNMLIEFRDRVLMTLRPENSPPRTTNLQW